MPNQLTLNPHGHYVMGIILVAIHEKMHHVHCFWSRKLNLSILNIMAISDKGVGG